MTNSQSGRPRFHFTAQSGWLNDPNGLLYCDGEYHLFFQHVPPGWGEPRKCWGHAVSRDLIHWRELPIAIPANDDHGPVWSGSAVVDEPNSLGLPPGEGKTLCAFFTGRKTWAQYLYTSVDRGQTWQSHPGNPVVPMITPGNRDPKVFWHEPTRRWVMVLWRRRPDNTQKEESPNGACAILTSTDLIRWEERSLNLGFFECPDLFELPLIDAAGESAATKWVMMDGSGDFVVGAFDGERFTPQTSLLKCEYGPHFYATQTWNHAPNGRRIQIAWMRWMSPGQKQADRYPGLPFDQQMSFPCELTLRATPDGPRLCRWPVREIESLRRDGVTAADLTLRPGEAPVVAAAGELFDAEFSIRPSKTSAGIFVLQAYGQEIRYDAVRGALSCGGKTANVKPVGGKLPLRVLVDRTSLEVFAHHGAVSMAMCFVPGSPRTSLRLSAESSELTIAHKTFILHRLA